MISAKLSIVGIMSGTSLDGVDIAACKFEKTHKGWNFCLCNGRTFMYDSEILAKLKVCHTFGGRDLAMFNVEYGEYLGKLAKHYIDEIGFKADYVASHGYTVFHEPQNRMTLQIGSGAHIAAQVGVPVVCDFRTTDVAFAGNGAPFVPIGDKLLFGNYIACLNIGGFANISFDKEGRRIAFDICPANIILNMVMRRIGVEYDENGKVARQGVVDDSVFRKLNSLDYYKIEYPKSLGREFVETEVLPIIQHMDNVSNLTATLTHHIAYQIGNVIKQIPSGSVLVTGGGAYNKFLIELIEYYSERKIIIPSKAIIDLKEAIIFAFLAALRVNNINNCLESVTGALHDNIGGAIYTPYSLIDD